MAERPGRFIAFILLLVSTPLWAGSGDSASRLASRLLGEDAAKQFVFTETQAADPATREFTIDTLPDGRIRISGDDAISMAAGLNGYLKEVAKCHVSWSGDQLHLPDPLPRPSAPIHRVTRERHATAFNYCTFNYTMAWWDAKRWEREIDLLALQGIDQPLAVVGTEAVWFNVLKRIGYTPEQAREFIAGPAYTAWWLMGNIECVGGPVSEEFIASRVALQRRILQRMRELNMRPVFQGFVGIVPASLPQVKPGTRILPQGQWVGMPRPPVLHPDDPLFKVLAKAWYEELEKLYGRADLFAGDLFHEGGNPNGIDVPAMAAKVQAAMLAHRPESVWSLQGWSGNPRPALLKGLRKDRTEVVELCNEFFRNWEPSDGFSGTPWLFGTIIQYGGNTGLHGRLADIEGNLADARKSPNPPSGIGLTWESTGINPVTAEFLTDLRWRQDRPDLETWTGDYAVRRYGIDTPGIRKAWSLLLRSAYGVYPNHRRPTESIFCARPGPDVRKASPFAASVEILYDLRDLRDAIRLLLAEAPRCGETETWRFDLIDTTRQYLSGVGLVAYREFTEADKAGDAAAFDRASREFLEMLSAQDHLLAAEPSLLLGKWLADARSTAPNGEADDFEFQARSLITTWFPDRRPASLSDYAWREWSGLLSGYYKPRWQAWLDFRHTSLSGKRAFAPDWQKMEAAWANQTLAADPHETEASGDPAQIVTGILKHWGGIADDANRCRWIKPGGPKPVESARDAR